MCNVDRSVVLTRALALFSHCCSYIYYFHTFHRNTLVAIWTAHKVATDHGRKLQSSVEQAFRASAVGKEMLEGEEAVALVKDVAQSAHMLQELPDEVVAANGSAASNAAGLFDIDSRDGTDEFCVTEYTDEIYSYLRANETRSQVDPDYMSRQADINAKMRVILNDWLVEVHLKFKLRQETLYLCFQLIDRFLEITGVQRQKLQLVGVTGLMLASKYEEIYPPEVRDYVYICDNAYTRDEILKMEQVRLRLFFPKAHTATSNTNPQCLAPSVTSLTTSPNR